jgi:hypothetical protein
MSGDRVNAAARSAEKTRHNGSNTPRASRKQHHRSAWRS